MGAAGGFAEFGPHGVGAGGAAALIGGSGAEKFQRARVLAGVPLLGGLHARYELTGDLDGGDVLKVYQGVRRLEGLGVQRREKVLE